MTNKEIIAAIFAETAKGNGRPFVEAMAEDCVWRAPGIHSWGGEYRGREAILRDLLQPLRRRISGGATHTIPSRIHDAGEFIIVEADGRNTTTEGQAYNNTYCFVIRVREGKMIEIVEYADSELETKVLGDRAAA
jgi:ketosteroid isomerase-like protein